MSINEGERQYWGFLRDFFGLPPQRRERAPKQIVIGKFTGRTAEDVRQHCRQALERIGSTPLYGNDAFKGQLFQMLAVLAREIEDLRG